MTDNQQVFCACGHPEDGDSHACPVTHRRLTVEIDLLRAALKTGQQALLEFKHAQECGPRWYTHGEDGMYRQVSMWLSRGFKAMRNALGPYDDNGEFLKERPNRPADGTRDGDGVWYGGYWHPSKNAEEPRIFMYGQWWKRCPSDAPPA